MDGMFMKDFWPYLRSRFSDLCEITYKDAELHRDDDCLTLILTFVITWLSDKMS